MGVAERSQNLAFAAKVPFEFRVGKTLPNDFQRDLLLKFAVGTFREENRTHPATTDFPQDTIGAKALSVIGVLAGLQSCGQVDGIFLKQVVRFVVSREQRLNLAA